MDLQNLMPQQAQPISRITSGQLPTELAELSEDVLGSDISLNANVLPSSGEMVGGDPTHDTQPIYDVTVKYEGNNKDDWMYAEVTCSYDGDDAE